MNPKDSSDEPQTYWVPENHLFRSDGDCLDAFPDAGPACPVVPVKVQRDTQDKPAHREWWIYKTGNLTLASCKPRPDHIIDYIKVVDIDALTEANAKLAALEGAFKALETECKVSKVYEEALNLISGPNVSHDGLTSKGKEGCATLALSRAAELRKTKDE